METEIKREAIRSWEGPVRRRNVQIQEKVKETIIMQQIDFAKLKKARVYRLTGFCEFQMEVLRTGIPTPAHSIESV